MFDSIFLWWYPKSIEHYLKINVRYFDLLIVLGRGLNDFLFLPDPWGNDPI